MNTGKLYLSKRSNGIYRIGYFEGSILKWKSTGCKLKSEALNALKNFETTSAKRTSSGTLSTFTTEFLAYASQNHSSGTVDLYRAALRFLSETIGDLPLCSITPRHADNYKTSRLRALKKFSLTEKVKPVTVNMELRTLRAAFNVALRWKLIVENPFKGITLAQVPDTAPQFFSKEEIKGLLDSIQQEWLKNIMVFALLTGCRRGEIINLRWENVDIQRRTITLESTASFRVKCGKRRVVPLSASAIYLLTQSVPPSQTGFVFEKDGKRINDDILSHTFKDYVRAKFGEKDERHWHNLRHSFASYLVQGGASLYSVQKLLGHSSSAMTMVYAHLLPEQLHSTVDTISLQLN